MAEEKKEISKLLTDLDKKFGKGTVFQGNEAGEHLASIPRWKLDAPSIAYVLGGGLPKGRIIELYGTESAGKTTLATYFAVQVQKSGGTIAVIDVENAYDMSFYSKHGLDTSKVIFTQPQSGEDALEIASDLAQSGQISLIIVDSIAALTPRAEIEGEMGDMQMGAQARLMGKGCRKLSSILQQNQVTAIFLNQIRMKIGVMFGNPECVTPDTLVEIL